MLIVLLVVLVWTIFRVVPFSGAPPELPGRSETSLGSDRDAPHLVGKRSSELRLVLPPRFEQALATEEGGFVTLGHGDFDPEVARVKTNAANPARQTPFAVVTDFDGDARRDVALLQKSNTHGRAIAVLDGPAPRVVELRRWSWNAPGTGGRTSFHLVAVPGEETGPQGGTGGVQLAYPGLGKVTYRFRAGRFRASTREP